MRLEFECSDEVRTALASVGRTEDILFSPDGSRLAIAGYDHHVVLILDVEVLVDEGQPSRVLFSRSLVLRSPSFQNPHGLSWIDNETLVVANRYGQVPIVRVPRANAMEMLVHPIVTIGSVPADLTDSPGSVTARQLSGDLVEVLVCNNFAHTVTRHLLDTQNGFSILHSETAFRDQLNVPDSIALSSHGEWTAVSNHYENAVFIYRSDGSSVADLPQGRLRGIGYPHGLRFTHDDRAILVADAGAPVVHIFASTDGDWAGTRQPLGAIEVMDHETFVRGNTGPEEGGPKGIALSPDGGLLFVTCEEEPLLVFNVRQELERVGVRFSAGIPTQSMTSPSMRQRLTRSLDDARMRLNASLAIAERLGLDLAVVARRSEEANERAALAEMRARATERQLADVLASSSWRITAPLRHLRRLLTRRSTDQ